jgi:hypothetical protein
MPRVIVTPAIRHQVRRLWAEHTLTQIATLAGVSVKTVTRIGQSASLPSKTRIGHGSVPLAVREPRPPMPRPIARPLWFTDREQIERMMMEGR